ncbi:hypothetical protein [Kosakonia sp. YIM B13611]|uniref:hypothetical protein n=1 Tax=unclassified Kosakonia TaxID=2632876 RepID=UPI003693FFA1
MASWIVEPARENAGADVVLRAAGTGAQTNRINAYVDQSGHIRQKVGEGSEHLSAT